MRFSLIAVPALVAMMAFASPVQADKWYRSPYFWGGTGLVVGGVIGHEIGRANSRPVYYDHANYSYSPYVGRYGGDTYYKETRVWPFYRRIESYPVANTRSLGIGQGTDNAGILASSRYDRESTDSRDERQVNINLGDNNQNVSIVVEGRSREVKEFRRATVENTGQVPRGRMIDTLVPVEPAAEETTTTTEEVEPTNEDNATLE